MMGFIGILLGVFAISVMQLVLAAALPQIVSEIGGGNLYSFVFTSYMLASLITIPIFSKLADLYGKKKFYITGMIIFALGSLLGGLSKDMHFLIISRSVQGLGAGIITPISLAMISDMFSRERRGRMIGVFGMIQILANLVSPSAGGFISKHLSWHWLFFLTLILVTISISIVAAACNINIQKNNSKPRMSELDMAGGILFGAFCVLTVGFLNTICKHSQANYSQLLFLLGIVITAIFLVLNEKKQDTPVIKLEFFKVKIIRTSIISSIISGGIMYGMISLLPLCGTVVSSRGIGISESFILLFLMIGISTGLLINSVLPNAANRSGVAKALWAVMSGFSIVMLYSLQKDNQILFYISNILIGFCVGGIMSTFLINSQNAVKSEDRTILSGLVQLGRYLGASIGVTILTSILPEVGQIEGAEQFIGSFLLLAVLCAVGLINETI